MARFASLFAALLAQQACSAEPTGPGVGRGVVAGVVKLGPIVPVCRESEPCDGVYKGAKVLVRAMQGGAVHRTTAGDDGTFWVDVLPGRHEVSVEVAGPLPHCAPVEVAVASGATSRVEIDCDSGIR